MASSSTNGHYEASLHADNSTYNYTVESFLQAAGRSPSTATNSAAGHRDHIVELQLIVAGVNRLQKNIYNNIPHWQRDIVEFFDQEHNIQTLTAEENSLKHDAISRVINGTDLTPEIEMWLDPVRDKFIQIKEELPNCYCQFKIKVSDVLDLPYGIVATLINWPFYK